MVEPVSKTTERTGPRGNRIDHAGISAMVCRTMAKFNRGLAERPDISDDIRLDDLELAQLWDAAAKDAETHG